MTHLSLWLRGLLVSLCLLGSTSVAHATPAVQSLRMCDLFSTDKAGQLVGEPIANTVEGAENAQWVCARYGQHAATLLELKYYQTEQSVYGGTDVPGLGDSAALITSEDGHLAVLRVASGRFIVSLEVSLDDEPTLVTADDLAPLVQRVLDNLPQPIASTGCDPDAATAIARYLASPDITAVEIIGGCHYLAIATRLADSGSAIGTAMDICDKAAAEVYKDGVIKSIAVTSNGGKELAIGIKDASCIGEL